MSAVVSAIVSLPLPYLMIEPTGQYQFRASIQANSIVGVPGGGVGEDDLVALDQSLHDLDGIHRAPSELHLGADGGLAVLEELEQTDGALRLTVGRSSHVEHVSDPLELDGAVDAQIGPRSFGERSHERHVHGDRSFLDGG